MARQPIMMLLIMGVMSAWGCKDAGDQDLNSQVSGAQCLLDELIKSLEINVRVQDPRGGALDFDYEFAEAGAAPANLPQFQVPFIASPEQTIEGSNGTTKVGHHMAQGLLVNEYIRMFRARHASACKPTTQWASEPAIQDHSITVLVNGQPMIAADFEIHPELVTTGCNAGESARQVLLEIANLNSNRTFLQRRRECAQGAPGSMKL